MDDSDDGGGSWGDDVCVGHDATETSGTRGLSCPEMLLEPAAALSTKTTTHTSRAQDQRRRFEGAVVSGGEED